MSGQDPKQRADQREEEADVPPILDEMLQKKLGEAIQAHYDDIVKAPVPDRFLALLAELEAKEQSHGRK
jgi:hypothetical protein